MAEKIPSKMEQGPARKRSQTPYSWELPGLGRGISSHLPGRWHPLPPTEPASPKWELFGLGRDGWSHFPTGHPVETEQQLPLSMQQSDLLFLDGSVGPEDWREALQAKAYSSDHPSLPSIHDDLFTRSSMAEPQSFGSYSSTQPGGRGRSGVGCMEPAPLLASSCAQPEQQAWERPLSSAKAGQQGRELKLQVLGRILSLARDREVQLSALLSKVPERREDLKEVDQVRQEVLVHYERVVLANVEFAEEQKVTQGLWKKAFHQVIQRFRQLLQHPAGPVKAEPIRESLLQMLEQGAAFFDRLLRDLQQKHRFNLEELAEGAALGSKPAQQGPLKCALAVAQKTLICLGDLCRYAEETRGTQNFGRARSCYLKAHRLDPSDGHPWNQLALLAVCTRRKVDAVCYFMRALAAARPSVSSEENLRQLFEGTKRRAQERAKLALRGRLGPGDLAQSFTCTFLQAHALLFSGTGMETFPAVADALLHKFQLLLATSPAAIGKHQMLRLLTINSFAVHYWQKKEREAAEVKCSGCRGEATALALAMVHALLSCCTSWLRQQALPGAPGSCAGEEDPPAGEVLVSAFGPALKTLLPSVKVGLGWMVVSRARWSPPPPSSWNPSPDVSQELWLTLRHFWKSLRLANASEVPVSKEPGYGLALLVLEEDQLLEGFGPLLASPREPCYVEQKSERLLAADCARVHALRHLLEALGARSWHVEELKAKQLIVAQQLEEQRALEEKIKAVVEGQAAKRPTEEERRPRFLVVDTNCFIQHLEQLSQLVERQSYVVLVPLMVFHELWGLSKGHQGELGASQSSRELQQRAQDSLVFLEQQFALSNSHLRALSPCGKELASIACQKKNVLSQQGNNDDHILSCCLKFQPVKTRNKGRSGKKKKIPVRLRPGDLVLFTDDKTLRVKALASNVPVWDKEKFLQEMERLCCGRQGQHHQHRCGTHHQHHHQHQHHGVSKQPHL